MIEEIINFRPCHKGVLWKRLADDRIAICTNDMTEINLSAMDSDILIKCEGKETVGEIASFLKKKYKKRDNAEIEKKLVEFLSLMESLNLVQMDQEEF